MIKEDLKFDVRGNPELSKKIQELLFDLGCGWDGYDNEDTRRTKCDTKWPFILLRGRMMDASRNDYSNYKLTTLTELKLMLDPTASGFPEVLYGQAVNGGVKYEVDPDCNAIRNAYDEEMNTPEPVKEKTDKEREIEFFFGNSSVYGDR